MLLLILSFLCRLIPVVGQCSLEGAFAEALDKFPCLPTSTLTACELLYDPSKLENKRYKCGAPGLAQAFQQAEQCIADCGNDGPCGEGCSRRYDIDADQIIARCDAAYERDIAAAKCNAYNCYQGLSCESGAAEPEPEPKPETPDPPPNPGVPTPPPPAQCERRDYDWLRCPVGTNAACISGGSGTKLVQKPIGRPNGCGAEGDGFQAFLRTFLAIAIPQFRSACYDHDNCFGTCSFGDDTQFETCNANLLTSSLKICYDYFQNLPANAFEICLAQAGIVYGAVQGGGCDPYRNAQLAACDCVPCDKVPMASNQITLDLLSTVQSVCAGIVSSITNAWPTFVGAVDVAARLANDVDRAALRFYAGRIGSSSPVTSPQVAALSASCGHGPRRKRNRSFGPSSSKERRAEASLTSFFGGLKSTDRRAYSCGPNDAQDVCETALALLEIARLARQIESYAGSPSPSTGGASSTLISYTSTSSLASYPNTATVSSTQITTIDIASQSSIHVSSSQSASGGSGTGNSELANTASTDDASSHFGGVSSPIVLTAGPSSVSTASVSVSGSPFGSSDLAHTTSYAAESPSSFGVTSTSLQPTRAPTGPISATTTQVSDTVPTPSVSATACILVKIYGDSPDTPDSPDGQVELPEIPDYPGGYYYMCQDGSIPPRSLLPSPFGSATVSPSSSSGPLTGELTASTRVEKPASCVWTRIYGDSPDTPDTPDSPDGQAEIPEIPETPQDGGFYWQCA